MHDSKHVRVRVNNVQVMRVVFLLSNKLCLKDGETIEVTC